MSVLPGKAVAEMSLEEAILTKDIRLVRRVVFRRGHGYLPRFKQLVQEMIDTGDDAAECLEFLLSNKQRWFARRHIDDNVSWPEGNPRVLEVLLKHRNLWKYGSNDLKIQTREMMDKTKDEFYARKMLGYFPEMVHWTIPHCKSVDFAQAILDELVKYKPRDVYALRRAKVTIYTNAVKDNNLELMRFVADACPDARLEMWCADTDWFARELLSQPLTAGRKEVLIQAMMDFNVKKTSQFNFVLYMIDDKDLIENPTPTEFDVRRMVHVPDVSLFDEGLFDSMDDILDIKPDEFVDLLLEHGIDNVPAHRLREMVNEHLSVKKVRWIQGLRDWRLVTTPGEHSRREERPAAKILKALVDANPRV